MPYKSFVDGDVLTAQEVNEYWMQGVIVFDDATARDASLTAPTEGQVAYLKDTNAVTFYNGSSWTAISFIGPAVLSGGTTANYSSSGSNYTTHTFTSTGTLTCSTAGIADVLLIGPGGAGTSAFGGQDAGGGGGGFVELFNVYIPAGSHTVTVDDPISGATSNSRGITRQTSFLDIVAFAGGTGNGDPLGQVRSIGASGGGTLNAGYSGRVPGQGNIGASGATNTGGGGAGSAASGTSGGAGKASSMSGTSVTYSAGGDASSSPASSGSNPGDGGSPLTGSTNAEQAGSKGIAIIRVKRIN